MRSPVLFLSALCVALAVRASTVFVASDAYHDTLEAGWVRFTASYPASLADGSSVEAVFTWTDAFGEPRRTAAKDVTAMSAAIDLPLYHMAMGESAVICELRAGGRLRSAGTNRFTRVEKLPARKVALDGSGRCLVDGKPFLPLGLSVDAGAPFNCILEQRDGRPCLCRLAGEDRLLGRIVADPEEARRLERDDPEHPCWGAPRGVGKLAVFDVRPDDAAFGFWRQIAAGANGLVGRVAAADPDSPAWREIRRAANEVKRMEDVILSAEAAPRATADHKAAVCRTWIRHGDLFVLAVNPLAEPLSFGVRLSEGDWKVDGTEVGAASVACSGDAISFTLPPRGVSFVRLVKRQDDLAASETARWQAAIDAVSANGGGRVSVPAGRHRVGQLHLKSNVELHLEKGAVLEGIFGWDAYPSLELPNSEGVWRAVVFANGVTNVAVTGEGTVFGDGSRWPGAPANYRGCQEGYRARGMFFNACRGVRLEDFTLRDSASWGIVFKLCDGVTARRVRIDNHGNRNNDGFDIEAKNVLIEDCDVDSGDDAVCIKSNTPDFTVENVTVRGCVARSQCNCYKIGTASHGTIRNVRFERCRIEAPRRDHFIFRGGKAGLSAGYWREPVEGCPFGTASGGLCVECVDGGWVEGITFSDIEIDGGVSSPIFVRGGTRTGRKCGIPANRFHILRDVVFENIRGRASGVRASSITGVDGCRVRNVTLKDVRLTCPGAGAEASGRAWRTKDGVPYRPGMYPDANSTFESHILPAFGLYIDRADDVRMENVSFTLAEGATDMRPPVYRTKDVK